MNYYVILRIIMYCGYLFVDNGRHKKLKLPYTRITGQVGV